MTDLPMSEFDKDLEEARESSPNWKEPSGNSDYDHGFDDGLIYGYHYAKERAEKREAKLVGALKFYGKHANYTFPRRDYFKGARMQGRWTTKSINQEDMGDVARLAIEEHEKENK